MDGEDRIWLSESERKNPAPRIFFFCLLAVLIRSVNVSGQCDWDSSDSMNYLI